MIMIIIIINATWTSAIVPDVTHLAGKAGHLRSHNTWKLCWNRKCWKEKMLTRPSLGSTSIIQTSLGVAGPGRAGSSRGKQQQQPQQNQPREWLQQSWHRGRIEKAAGVVVRMEGHREIWGKNIIASFLSERFAQKTLGTTALGAVLLKIEQVLFQQIWIH